MSNVNDDNCQMLMMTVIKNQSWQLPDVNGDSCQVNGDSCQRSKMTVVKSKRWQLSKVKGYSCQKSKVTVVTQKWQL